MEYLIRPEWFFDQPQWLLLLLAAASIAALVKGADWLVGGASGIAHRAGIPKVIVGATIVSLGTTSPEAAVSVMAAWSGRPEIALGNGIGSIIADTGLIFGLGCVIAPLPADRFVLSRQGWVQFGAALLLAAICYGLFAIDGDAAALGRPVGILLVLLLVGYMFISIRWSRQHPHGEPFQTPDRIAGQAPIVTAAVQASAQRQLCWPLLQTLVGLVVVVLFSHVLICDVDQLARQHWHVPRVVISATLVALGTSLPELVVGMAAIVKGHKQILVGNVIGADILNVLFVVGASATAAPLAIVEQGATTPNILLWAHLPTMLLVLVLFRLFIWRAVGRGQFSRWFGVPLLVIYVAYTVLLYGAGRT